MAEFMKPRAELLLLTTVQQLIRTGEILARAKLLLSEPAFCCVLTRHSISHRHATMAMEFFHEARQVR